MERPRAGPLPATLLLAALAALAACADSVAPTGMDPADDVQITTNAASIDLAGVAIDDFRLRVLPTLGPLEDDIGPDLARVQAALRSGSGARLEEALTTLSARISSLGEASFAAPILPELGGLGLVVSSTHDVLEHGPRATHAEFEFR